jgi:hypothetical protein
MMRVNFVEERKIKDELLGSICPRLNSKNKKASKIQFAIINIMQLVNEIK